MCSPWSSPFLGSWKFLVIFCSHRIAIYPLRTMYQIAKILPAMQETRVWKIPWRREWPPTPVFLPGESHGEEPGRSLELQGVGHDCATNAFTFFHWPWFPMLLCSSLFPYVEELTRNSISQIGTCQWTHAVCPLWVGSMQAYSNHLSYAKVRCLIQVLAP